MTKRKKLSAILLGAILALGVGAGLGASRVETGKAAIEMFTIGLRDNSLGSQSAYTANQTTANYDGGDATASLHWNNMNPKIGQLRGNQTTQSNLQGTALTHNFSIRNTTALPGNVRSFSISGVDSGTFDATKAWVATGSSEISNQAKAASTAGTASGTTAITWSFTGESGTYFAFGGEKGVFAGNFYATSIIVTYETGGGAPLPNVESLDLVSGPTKKVYNDGETFDPTGVHIHADFADGSDANVTSAVTYTPNPLTVGTTKVVASFTQGVTMTIDITGLTVNAAPTFTLSSASNLKVGATYTIATKTGFAISSKSTTFFSSTAVTYSAPNNTFPSKAEVLKLELENGSVPGSYAFKILNTSVAGEYIIYDSTTGGNALHSAAKTTVDADASWTFHDTDGIRSVGTAGRILQYNSGSPRFACYTTSQVKAFLFVDESTIPYEPEFETTTRIEIASDFAKTTFFTHETFTSAGLLIIAHDDNNGVFKNVDSGFNTNLDGKVFASSDVADGVSVTVTYDGVNETYLIDVKEARSFVKVESTSQLEADKIYVATGINSDENVVAMGKEEGNNRNSVPIIADTGKVFENNDVQLLKLHNGHADVDDSFAFESIGGPKNGKFLAATSTSSNYMTSQDDITVKGSWVITINAETSVATIVATGAGTDRNSMKFNRGDNIFSAYSSEQTPITLYVLEEEISDPDIIAVDAFVADFMHPEIETSVSGTGECTTLGYYAAAKAEFNNVLTPAQRALFVGDDAFEAPRARLAAWARANGDVLNTSTNVLESATSPAQNPFFNGLNDGNTIMLIIIISLISVSVLGGVFYLRKREQN